MFPAVDSEDSGDESSALGDGKPRTRARVKLPAYAVLQDGTEMEHYGQTAKTAARKQGKSLLCFALNRLFAWYWMGPAVYFLLIKLYSEAMDDGHGSLMLLLAQSVLVLQLVQVFVSVTGLLRNPAFVIVDLQDTLQQPHHSLEHCALSAKLDVSGKSNSSCCCSVLLIVFAPWMFALLASLGQTSPANSTNHKICRVTMMAAHFVGNISASAVFLAYTSPIPLLVFYLVECVPCAVLSFYAIKQLSRFKNAQHEELQEDSEEEQEQDDWRFT